MNADTPVLSLTPVERELWATVLALNAAWTGGKSVELSRYFHPDMLAITATERHRIEGGPACIAAWKAFADVANIHYWHELDPAIRIFGDAAVVAYDFDMAFDVGADTVNMAGRDMFFFVRQEGKWWVVADQFSRYPSPE
jgi:hypothetical protein